MIGNIQLENFKGITQMPQRAASAWAALDGLVGCHYVPLIYLGEQLVHGTNFWFIAEQTSVTLNPTRRVVKLAIHRTLAGEYKLGDQPIEIIA